MDFEQFSRETKLPLEDAGRLIARLRASQRPAHTTVWRWCKRGLQVKRPHAVAANGDNEPGANKVRLEYRRIGGRIITTEQAVRRFLDATQDSEAPAQPRPLVAPPADTAATAASVRLAKERIASFVAPSLHAGPRSPSEHGAVVRADQAKRM